MNNTDILKIALVIAVFLMTGFILNALNLPNLILENFYSSIDILAAQVPEGPFTNTSAIGITTMKACITFLMSFAGGISTYFLLMPSIKKITSF